MATDARNGTHVVFLEDDADLREIVVELMAAFGTTCDAVGSVAELQDLFARPHGDVRLIILDVNLGANAPTGVDAYEWLRQSGYRGPISFLTGHARTHPLLAKATLDGDVTVLEKPITNGQLRELLERCA